MYNVILIKNIFFINYRCKILISVSAVTKYLNSPCLNYICTSAAARRIAAMFAINRSQTTRLCKTTDRCMRPPRPVPPTWLSDGNGYVIYTFKRCYFLF